jgi:hypothetical protein
MEEEPEHTIITFALVKLCCGLSAKACDKPKHDAIIKTVN